MESELAIALQLKRFFAIELPPVGFWQWLCGGLSVLDAILVVLWLCLALTWVWGESATRVSRLKSQ